MNRFASDLVSKKVILRQQGMLAGEVEEVIINPENGVFLGFVIKSQGKKDQKLLAEKDIMGINEKFILVNSIDVLGGLDDIVRIKEVRDKKISITRNKVYTVSNLYLGRVADYTVDLISSKLSRIYVEPSAMSAIYRITNQHVIEARHILSIKKNQITVDDNVIKKTAKKRLGAVAVKSECN